MMSLEFHRSRYILLLAAVLSFCFLNGCRKPKTLPMTPADQWQARIMAAHGGSKALARISTLVYTGKIATRGDRGTVVLVLSRPQKLRTTMKYLKRYEDRILLGKRGWRNFGTGFEEATGPSLDAMLFQYNHLSLPMGFIDNNYKITYTEQKIGAKIFPALELIGADGPPMTVIIDDETGLIQLIEGKISTGGREVAMGVGYGDYREVGGVMLPYRIINYVNGKAIAESRYDTVAVNAELDANYFSLDSQALVK
jgi:hypothetical protein